MKYLSFFCTLLLLVIFMSSCKTSTDVNSAIPPKPIDTTSPKPMDTTLHLPTPPTLEQLHSMKFVSILFVGSGIPTPSFHTTDSLYYAGGSNNDTASTRLIWKEFSFSWANNAGSSSKTICSSGNSSYTNTISGTLDSFLTSISLEAGNSNYSDQEIIGGPCGNPGYLIIGYGTSLSCSKIPLVKITNDSISYKISGYECKNYISKVYFYNYRHQNSGNSDDSWTFTDWSNKIIPPQLIITFHK